MFVISMVVLIAAWFKRLIIVVPTQDHPFLPIQHVPKAWMVYQPTVVESAITIGTLLLVVIIITVLVKFFPIRTPPDQIRRRERLGVDFHSRRAKGGRPGR